MGGMPLLTIKLSRDFPNNYLYSQLNTGVAPLGPTDDYPGGCCVDSFRAFNIDGSDYTEFDIMNIVFDIYANVSDTDSNTGRQS